MKKRVGRDGPHQPTKPTLAPVNDGAPPKEESVTAIAAEAMRTGILRGAPERRPAPLPHEDALIQVGDPDDDSLANEYVGEDTPGGTSPTPDQNDVDEIGRAYGLQEEDNSGGLRAGGDVLERRDRHRQELRPPSKPRG